MERSFSLYKRQVNFCSVVLRVTRVIWLNVTGSILWVADEVTTVPGWLGAGETKLLLLHSSEVGSGCWAICLLGLCGHCCIPRAVTWHQHHAERRATLHYRAAVWRAVILLPAGETRMSSGCECAPIIYGGSFHPLVCGFLESWLILKGQWEVTKQAVRICHLLTAQGFVPPLEKP